MSDKPGSPISAHLCRGDQIFSGEVPSVVWDQTAGGVVNHDEAIVGEEAGRKKRACPLRKEEVRWLILRLKLYTGFVYNCIRVGWVALAEGP